MAWFSQTRTSRSRCQTRQTFEYRWHIQVHDLTRQRFNIRLDWKRSNAPQTHIETKEGWFHGGVVGPQIHVMVPERLTSGSLNGGATGRLARDRKRVTSQEQTRPVTLNDRVAVSRALPKHTVDTSQACIPAHYATADSSVDLGKVFLQIECQININNTIKPPQPSPTSLLPEGNL